MKQPSLLLFSLFFFINAASVFACLCDGTSTVAEELQGATAVFAGKYVGSEYRSGIVNEFRRMQEEMDGKKVEYKVLVLKFRVEQWWKGNLSDEVIIVTDHTKTADGSETISDCGLGFEVGKRYLVYAFGDKNKLGTDACTRTKNLRKAKEDLKELGVGKKPVPALN